MTHTAIMRWVQRYIAEFEKRWNGYPHKARQSSRVDNTYVKIHGRWVYLYRVVDRDGNSIDFRLIPKRDVAAAKAFFRNALKTQGRAPDSITLDGCAASHGALRELQAKNDAWQETKLRSSKYLNNLIDRDHRGVKSRVTPMLGFKAFDRAAITIAGIFASLECELIERRSFASKDRSAPRAVYLHPRLE